MDTAGGGALFLDTELVDELVRRKGGGRAPISVSTLRKDRLAAQRLPFVRIGGRILYDVDRVIAALAANSHGGRRAPTSRREREAGGRAA